MDEESREEGRYVAFLSLYTMLMPWSRGMLARRVEGVEIVEVFTTDFKGQVLAIHPFQHSR